MMNITFDWSMWNRPEVLDNIMVRVGEHSLTLDEDTQIDMKVREIVGHPDYSQYIDTRGSL